MIVSMEYRGQSVLVLLMGLSCSSQDRSNPQQLSTQPNMTIVPPKIRPFHFPPDLSSGSRTRLTCEAAEGDLPLSFQWQHQGRDLTPLPGISMASMDSFSSTISMPMVK